MKTRQTPLDRFHPAWLALMSSGLGAGYVVYLNLDSFPPDIVRIVPVIWLVAAIAGLSLSLQAARANDRRLLSVVSTVLCTINVPAALLFTFAAAIGD